MKELRQFGSFPFTHSNLLELLHGYNSPGDKISSLIKNGDIISLKRGLYINAEEYRSSMMLKFQLANVIYGPSYVSMESALSEYGLIPEGVFSTRSVTLKRSRTFINKLGRFEYFHSPEKYYSIGIGISSRQDEGSCLLASPEKALCDKIVFSKNSAIQSEKEMLNYLEDDLRLDFDLLRDIDISVIKLCAAAGRKKALLELVLKIVFKIKG